MSIDFSSGPLPEEVDRVEFLPFWEGTRRGELRFPKCQSCHRFHWYPQLRCPYCRSPNIGWASVRPRGRVYSWTCVHYVFHPGFTGRVPFIVAFVEPDDAPNVRLVTNVVGCSPDRMRIDLPVEVTFQKVTKKVVMPVAKALLE